MPKRETVKVNYADTTELLRKNHWSGAAFSKILEKHERWWADVRKGKNLPSPEEAARICAILNVMPEDILLTQEDIAKVKALLEGGKEDPTGQKTGGMHQEFIELFNQLSPEEQAREVAYLRERVNGSSR